MNNKKELQMPKFIISESFEIYSKDYIVARALINHVITNRDTPVITYGEFVTNESLNILPRNLGRYLGKFQGHAKRIIFLVFRG